MSQRSAAVREERSSNGSSQTTSSSSSRPPLYAPSPSYHQHTPASTLLTRGRSTSPQLAELTAAAMDNGPPGPTSFPPSPAPPSSTSSPAQPPSHPTPPSPRALLSRPRTPRSLIDSDPFPHRRGEGPFRVLRLYYAQEFSAVAQEVARLSEGRVELCEIEWKKFPDGFPNLRIDKSNEMKVARTPHPPPSRCSHPPLAHFTAASAVALCHAVQWYHVGFLASFHSPEVFFEMIAVATYLPKLLPKSFKLFVPFFSTATMERVTRPGSPPPPPSHHPLTLHHPPALLSHSSCCVWRRVERSPQPTLWRVSCPQCPRAQKALHRSPSSTSTLCRSVAAVHHSQHCTTDPAFLRPAATDRCVARCAPSGAEPVLLQGHRPDPSDHCHTSAAGEAAGVGGRGECGVPVPSAPLITAKHCTMTQSAHDAPHAGWHPLTQAAPLPRVSLLLSLPVSAAAQGRGSLQTLR